MADEEKPAKRWSILTAIPAAIPVAVIQAAAVFALAALVITLFSLSPGLPGLAHEWLGTWQAFVDQVFEAVGLNALLEFFVSHVPDVLRNFVLIVAVVAISWMVEFFRRRRYLLERSGEIIGRVRGFAGTLGALISTAVVGFARFVVAPALSSAVTVSLTWNIHMWFSETYGPNYALASIGAVVAATCLLLALGLQRLIPG